MEFCFYSFVFIFLSVVESLKTLIPSCFVCCLCHCCLPWLECWVHLKLMFSSVSAIFFQLCFLAYLFSCFCRIWIRNPLNQSGNLLCKGGVVRVAEDFFHHVTILMVNITVCHLHPTCNLLGFFILWWYSKRSIKILFSFSIITTKAHILRLAIFMIQLDQSTVFSSYGTICCISN